HDETAAGPAGAVHIGPGASAAADAEFVARAHGLQHRHIDRCVELLLVLIVGEVGAVPEDRDGPAAAPPAGGAAESAAVGVAGQHELLAGQLVNPDAHLATRAPLGGQVIDARLRAAVGLDTPLARRARDRHLRLRSRI